MPSRTHLAARRVGGALCAVILAVTAGCSSIAGSPSVLDTAGGASGSSSSVAGGASAAGTASSEATPTSLGTTGGSAPDTAPASGVGATTVVSSAGPTTVATPTPSAPAPTPASPTAPGSATLGPPPSSPASAPYPPYCPEDTCTVWEGYGFDTGQGILGINSGPAGPVMVLRNSGHNVAWAKPRVVGDPVDLVCTKVTAHPHCILITTSPTGNKSGQLFLLDGGKIVTASNDVGAYRGLVARDLDGDGDLDIAALVQWREEGAPDAAPPIHQFWEIWILSSRAFKVGGCTQPVGPGEATPPPPTKNPGTLCAG